MQKQCSIVNYWLDFFIHLVKLVITFSVYVYFSFIKIQWLLWVIAIAIGFQAVMFLEVPARKVSSFFVGGFNEGGGWETLSSYVLWLSGRGYIHDISVTTHAYMNFAVGLQFFNFPAKSRSKAGWYLIQSDKSKINDKPNITYWCSCV